MHMHANMHVARLNCKDSMLDDSLSLRHVSQVLQLCGKVEGCFRLLRRKTCDVPSEILALTLPAGVWTTSHIVAASKDTDIIPRALSRRNL